MRARPRRAASASARSTDALQVLRVRVALGGGWVLRRGRFALPLRAAISIEPVVSRGATLRDRDGVSASPRPLVGALVRGSPSVVWWLRSGRAAVRASIELEVAASMEARAKPGVVRYVEAGDAARGIGRAGGVELARQRHDAAAEAKLWERYVRRFPGGRYVDEARAGLCRRASGDAATRCWRAYLDDRPRGTYRDQARAALGDAPSPAGDGE